MAAALKMVLVVPFRIFIVRRSHGTSSWCSTRTSRPERRADGCWARLRLSRRALPMPTLVFARIARAIEGQTANRSRPSRLRLSHGATAAAHVIHTHNGATSIGSTSDCATTSVACSIATRSFYAHLGHGLLGPSPCKDWMAAYPIGRNLDRIRLKQVTNGVGCE